MKPLDKITQIDIMNRTFSEQHKQQQQEGPVARYTYYDAVHTTFSICIYASRDFFTPIFLFSKYPNLLRFFFRNCVIPCFCSYSSSSSKSARNTTGTPLFSSCCFEGAQLKRMISGYPKTGSARSSIQRLHLGSLGYPVEQNQENSE